MDASQVEFLSRRLLNATPTELPVIRKLLREHHQVPVRRLWSVLQNSQSDPDQRLRAACALADSDAGGTSQRWDAVAPFLTDRLLASALKNPSHYTPLIEMLRPVRARLLAPLTTTFRDTNRAESERSLATSILADYASDRPDVLADLLMDADSKPFETLFPKIKARESKALVPLESELAQKPSPEAEEDDKDRLARRRANAAVALVRLGRSEKVWPLLRHGPDPSVRSYLVNRLKPLGADPKALVARLEGPDSGTSPIPIDGPARMGAILFHPETSARRALILSLGEYEAEDLSPGEREPLISKLVETYCTDPDAGIHGAAEWTLRQWKQQEKLEAADAELS